MKKERKNRWFLHQWLRDLKCTLLRSERYDRQLMRDDPELYFRIHNSSELGFD